MFAPFYLSLGYYSATLEPVHSTAPASLWLLPRGLMTFLMIAQCGVNPGRMDSIAAQTGKYRACIFVPAGGRSVGRSVGGFWGGEGLVRETLLR